MIRNGNRGTHHPRAAAFATALLVSALVPQGVGAQQIPQLAGRPVAVVGSIQVVGNERVQEATIFSEIGVRGGDTIRYAEIDRAMKRLWATGQFRDGARIIRERTKLLILLVPDAAEVRSKVEAVVRRYKARFRQQSVLRTESALCLSFD